MAKTLGSGGSITVSATAYYYKSCTITVDNETQDVTDTNAAGWIERLAGYNSATLDFVAFWGGAAATLSTVFAIGSSISATATIGTTGQSFVFPGIVKSFDVKLDPKTPVEFHCTMDSNGAVTMPT